MTLVPLVTICVDKEYLQDHMYLSVPSDDDMRVAKMVASSPWADDCPSVTLDALKAKLCDTWRVSTGTNGYDVALVDDDEVTLVLFSWEAFELMGFLKEREIFFTANLNQL